MFSLLICCHLNNFPGQRKTSYEDIYTSNLLAPPPSSNAGSEYVDGVNNACRKAHPELSLRRGFAVESNIDKHDRWFS